MKNKILFSIILVISLIFFVNTVTAYQNICYNRGQIIPGGISCNYDCCKACISSSGYTVLPQYCISLPDCTCTNSTTNSTPINPETEPAYCNATEINRKISALENRTLALENNVTTMQSLISSLQTNINSIQSLVTAIQNSINSILARLTALESGTPNPQPNVGCAYNNPSCASGYQCVDNACVLISNKEVIFRTNTKNYGSSNGEIVFDYDKDGDLDCFKYYSFYNNYFNNKPTILGKTVEGYDIIKYSNTQVIIKTGKNWIYQLSNSCVTPLTKTPTEPYASNGQELYK